MRFVNKIKLTFAFVGIFGGGSSPGGVVVEGQAFVAVRSCCVMFAATYPASFAIDSC